jgi:tetratricopeptide (TPR) repeat protein
MLTDTDGPYNEVQTGPLRTQAETGRLDPHELISWREWWYPVHGLGGSFTYANRDVCARAEVADGQLDLRIIGTGTWEDATILVARGESQIGSREADITPREPLSWKVDVGEPPVEVKVLDGERNLASFAVPLALPERQPPRQQAGERSPESIASEGWKMLLLGRRDEAIGAFEKALREEAWCVEAMLGLAHYKLIEAAPEEAEHLGRRAIAENPYDGRAHYVLAVSLDRLSREEDSLDSAWRAALDPATVVAARALIGKILTRQKRLEEAADVLKASGPWGSDPVSRDRLSIAFLQLGRGDAAHAVASGTIREQPLDALAWYVLARLEEPRAEETLDQLLSRDAECVLELALALGELGLGKEALAVLEKTDVPRSPMLWYTASYFRARQGLPGISSNFIPMEGVFPSRLEELPVLEDAVRSREDDATARLLLGDLRFHFHQHAAACALWEESAKTDPSNPVPWRSLGMAAWRIEGDLARAEQYLRRGLRADPDDGIVARDLARVLQAQAGAATGPAQRDSLLTSARDVLSGVLSSHMHRADIVEMLAHLHNQLDEPEKAAALLNDIRVTCWEGAQGLHDEFRSAHFALGKRHFEAERFAEAVAEFRRSLEYPENLGIGRREGTREADLYYWLGKALSQAGKREEARAAWKAAAEEPPSGRPEIERCRKLAQEALKEER